MPFTAFPIIPLGGGQKEDQPKQLIDSVFSPNSRDVIYKDNTVETRGGLTKEYTNDLLNPVLHMTIYKNFAGSEFLLKFTTKDVYRFDNTNNVPLFITPTYTTGTIDVTNGNKTVAGNGTLFDTTVDGRKNVAPGDFIRIGAVNAASAVWYEVDSITNDTSLELVIAYAETTDTTVAYTNRQVFTAASGKTFRTTNFTDENLGDIICAVNGNDGDFPVQWDGGAGQMVIIANAPKSDEINTLAGRLLFFNVLAGAVKQKQRYKWSAVSDAETYAVADIADITDTQGGIIGTHLFRDGNFIVVGKEDSKFQLRWVGGDFTFEHDLIDNVGVKAPHSMEEIPGFGLVYYGSDFRFRLYTGATDTEIAQSIFPTVETITPDNFFRIYSKYIPHKKQLRIAVPVGDTSVNNLMIALKIENFSWWIWDYQVASAIAAMEVFTSVQDLFVDDTAWTDRFVDEHDGFWDDNIFLEDAPIIYYGGDDNKFRRADSGLDDDGSTYTPIFDTKDMDFDQPMHRKRLWKYQIWAHSEVGKSLNISVKRDQALSFETSKAVSIDDTSRDLVKVNSPVFDAHGDTIQTRISATPPWRVIGLYALIKRLNKTV